MPSSTAVRQQAQHRCDHADHVHGAFVALAGHLRPDALDPLLGVDEADRCGEIDSGEPVSAGGVVVGSQVDRYRHRQGVDRHAHGLVVAPQRAAQPGQIRVVDRAAGRLGRPVQVTELDVDGVASRRQAAASQHRRRFGGRPHHPGTRHGVVDRAAHRRDRVADHASDRLGGTEQRVAHTAGDRAGQPVEPLPHQVVGRQVLRNRQRRNVLRRRIALEVVEVGEHLDAADAVGDGVTEMHHQGGPAACESLDERRRPQRPRDIQRRLQRDLGQIHHLTQRAGLGDAHPAHVKIEVEVRVDDPAGRRRRQRRHHHLLPQPQHLPRRVVESRPEPLPVRCGVENLQRHDPRARAGVGFAAVQYLVDGAEFLRGSGRIQLRHVAHGCGHPAIVAAPPIGSYFRYPR